MINKARKIRVWCIENPKPYRGCNDGLIQERSKLKIPSKIKCPYCKKKFNPRVRECNDMNCWHVYIPAHKKEINAT